MVSDKKKLLKLKKLVAEKVIPKGDYCYDENGICPYWDIKLDKPEQENGYCKYLNRGDWEVDYLSLLWDQVKECGVNENDE